MMQLKIQAKRLAPGFSLLEILVVLFIIAVGMIGVLTLISQNIQSQSLNKNNMIANQLAQEGIEICRRIRDNNWRQSETWNSGLANGTYGFDYRSEALEAIAAPEDLWLDANGFYVRPGAGGVSSTPFSRAVHVYNDSGPHSLRVVSEIRWSMNGRNAVYTLEAALYNWR